MKGIGLDAGCTYMTVSYMDKDQNGPRAMTLSQDSPYIPSVAAYDHVTGNYEFGRAAKSRTGRKNVSLFKGFKMLLPETDAEKLAKRGYDPVNTPEHITRLFLENLLKKVLADLNDQVIDRLVVCAPEIWNDGMDTLDGRLILSRICQDMAFVKEVQVVSEPAAATACFAYNYRMKNKKSYNGSILLVDYGGGTLDITLTSVSETTDGEKGAVEVRVLDRTGAGENEDGEIGKAGIVYMETVMAEAIRRSGGSCEPNGRFLKAVDELEKEILSRTDAIMQEFDVYLDYPEQLEAHIFTEIEYQGEDIPISYGLLAETYDRIIRGVLDENLEKMIGCMEKRGIPYMDGNREDFKIALVGGFGNFYLVKKQIENKFRFSVGDRRFSGIIGRREEREQAVSLGAALLADGCIRIRNTAAYSIGLWNYDPITGKPGLNYAIRYKQDLEYDRVYYARSPVDQAPTVIMAPKGGFRNFLINFGESDHTAQPALAKAEFAEKLSHVIANTYHTAVIGFSISQAGVISLHIHDYDFLNDRIAQDDHVIALTRYSDLFEITDVKRIF